MTAFFNRSPILFKKEERAGAGICCLSPDKRISIPLGEYATVFQAEVLAILICTYTIKEAGLFIRQIHICTDSQAALKALTSSWCKSKLLSECCEALNVIRRHYKIELFWIPGHVGISGNELADEVAKAGAGINPFGLEPFVQIIPSTAIAKIKTWGLAQHVKIWQEMGETGSMTGQSTYLWA
ncbi:uncharacterized protein LOC124162988 [Ischnura elegans]|uniref:uncharacterized protein LOC124162988 n=1 Tax=Ischnura elegans TaxID=197161 RepID=UPI001ED88334|nr:uncharacterized protein LOC124162988 [Ischnura elegans]